MPKNIHYNTQPTKARWKPQSDLFCSSAFNYLLNFFQFNNHFPDKRKQNPNNMIGLRSSLFVLQHLKQTGDFSLVHSITVSLTASLRFIFFTAFRGSVIHVHPFSPLLFT